MKIENNAFIVTGGGSGLGAATARMIVGAGGYAVLAEVNPAAAGAVVAELGDRALFVRTDVTDEASAEACIKAALGMPGPLRGLVNCAGIAIAELALRKGMPHSLASYSRVIAVNLIGTFNMIRLAAAAMASQAPEPAGERGVIVSTASVAAFDGQVGQAAYAASKGGVAAMTLPLAREYARYGIRVLAIAPGVFRTPMLAGLPEPAQLSLAQQVPFPQRLGDPAEYAALVRHMFENGYLNGEVVRLDGAIRMAPR
ncbi:MAG TPA: SDR family NAD(P)-dependent oxidoreductase [Thermoflexales bacterium]|nr:SDR family NAD(P)-dependent oxidoreductase [Thermoflexales bacterium]HQX09351.1 SDR family NAD(P)-dependent oxidoreductase [Thermoflexales bacterium]HQY24999.1 SDR family NAD(P)-dependent oxidoreductase [Thermoflexales bacterium]HQZ52263.1 SDR family NAD(P)-dependent oxidoreductase [Thermoflexales bacterium]HRA52982.1 SDR family NAD(P)-dependent oxidoreductase [Thermoflexales bacterium]